VKFQMLMRPARARLVARLVACLVACLVGLPAAAHHSTAMFEWGKEKTLEGTIDRYEWTQPHTFIWFNVPGKGGKLEQWGFEGMSPSWLGRRGWSIHSLKPGDKAKLVYYPLRDGRKGGFYVRVILPDGHTLEALPQRSG
jgi:Family of unknown function (DUF6152)